MAAPKGNQFARKARDWESALRRALEKQEGGLALAKIAEKVVAQAMAGEWRAIEEIANRIDGKPAQSVDITGLIEHRDITDITDEQLANIATGRSPGTTEQTPSEAESPPVH